MKYLTAKEMKDKQNDTKHVPDYKEVNKKFKEYYKMILDHIDDYYEENYIDFDDKELYKLPINKATVLLTDLYLKFKNLGYDFQYERCDYNKFFSSECYHIKIYW